MYNPADAPTRKRRIPPPEEPGPEYFLRKREVLQEHPWTLALNKYEWEDRFEHVSDDFDSTLGYPGEGPRGLREKVILGPVKEKEKQRDLRIQVQPETLARYKVKYDRWKEWLASERLPGPDKVTRSPALDTVMASYMQHMYNLDAPISHGLETLAALQLFHPHTIGELHRSWKAAKQWKRTQPLSIRAPLPLSVLLAMSCTAWLQGWWRTSALLLLSFDALLRPGEAA
eukprot:3449251-Amphidinium_carterae.2